jgi:hypothetical protein
MTGSGPASRRRRVRTQAERELWLDGYRVADSWGARRGRPNYLTRQEREAFMKAWDAMSRKKDHEQAVRELMNELLRPPINSN